MLRKCRSRVNGNPVSSSRHSALDAESLDSCFHRNDRERKDESTKKVLALKKEDMPLIIEYKDKRYVLILTKNDRLILQKAID